MTQEEQISAQVAEEIAKDFPPRAVSPRAEASMSDKLASIARAHNALVEQLEVAARNLDDKHRRELLDLQLTYERRVEAWLREQKMSHDNEVRSLVEAYQRDRAEHDLIARRLK